MRVRNLAVVGLATACSGRRIRARQAPAPSGYDDGNVTEAVTPTAVTYTTATVVVTAPSSYQSDNIDTTAIVAGVPSPSAENPPPNYDTTTTTYATSIQTVTEPTAYSSQQYEYAPSGGTPPAPAPSGYSGPGTDTTTIPPAYNTALSSVLPVTTVTQNATNGTCSGATLNVLDASLDWWYTKTLYYAVSTYSVQFNRNDTSTGWTALPATTTFNVTSALAEPDCTNSPRFVSSQNATVYDYSCTPAATPVAAETTIITQTAYKEPPAASGNGSLPQLVVTPKPASISVSDATQAPYAQGTPFVFFSQYEIVSKNPTTFGNGSTGCAEATQTYTMDQAFSFEYTGGDVNGSLLVNEGVVGDVNPALLGLVGQDTAVAGSWVAEPTVVLLMQEVVVAQAALAATVEPTASALDTPTPTRPPFITLAPTGPEGPPKITYSPRIESSETELLLPTRPGDDNRPTGAAEQNQGGNNGGGNNGGQAEDNNGRPTKSVVAFIAHIAHSEVTLDLPANPTQTVVTAAFEGHTVTATRLEAMQDTDGSGQQQGGGFGALIGAVHSAAQPPPPTNAFDVLSQAEETFEPGSNPTANAIINGMGGPAENGGGGGAPQADNTGGDANRAITAGGAVITPDPQGRYILPNGATLTPGGTAMMDGTMLSLNPGASAVVVNGVTQNLASPAQATGGSQAITVGGAVITPNAQNGYVLPNGQTLTPGEVAVVDGTTLSMDSAASAVVVNGVTQDLTQAAAGPDIPLITMGSATITPNAATEYSMGPGQTLTPGGEVVMDGTTVSLDSAATALVVNGQTRDLAGAQAGATAAAPGASGSAGPGVTSPASAAAAGTTMAPILTIDGHTFSAINGGMGTTYVIDGQTLTMGEEETVTIDGTAYQVSLAPEATRLVVETEDANGQVTASSTTTLFPEQGSGAGAQATSSGYTGPEEQAGNAASKVGAAWGWSGVGFAVGSLFFAVWL